MGALVQVDNDKLYGTTYSGGEFDRGVLFEWDISTNRYTKKADFNGTETGSHPMRSLVLADNGKLIGTTPPYQDGPPAIFEWDPSTNVLTKRYTFPSDANWFFPMGSLVKAKNGKIYGTACGGDINNSGEIFEWDPFANTYLKRFEGGGSRFTLTPASNGKLFGVTEGGTTGKGGIFEWDPNTNTFCNKCDYIGSTIYIFLCSPLIQADNGKFYGRLSSNGGEQLDGIIYEWDTIFNIATRRIGNTDLYLSQEDDSPMLQASNGKIYGISSGGGKYGKGTLFEYDPVKNIFETKTNFNTINGSTPSGGLIELKYFPTSSIVVEACNSYAAPSGRYVWTSSGVYKDTISGVTGCDSIITVNLTIIKVDTSLTLNSNAISANAIGAGYQWIDCGNFNAPIEDETQQNFTAGKDGSYAVIITQFPCIDTSACMTITGTTIHTFDQNITVFPNPNDGSFSIDLDKAYSNVNIAITESDGRMILMENYSNAKTINLKFDAEPGIYLVSVTTLNDRKVFKITKK